MTERWQRELKKLGGVEAPVSRMRAQIANGPSEDPPQPEPTRSPAQRITAGVVAFAVFAAAGVFAYRALRPGGVTPGVAGSQTVTIDLSRSSDASRAIGDVASLSAQFSATLTSGGSSIQEAPSSVCVSGSQCLAPAPRPLDLTLTSGSPVHLSAYNVQGRVELSQTNGDSTDTLLLTNDSTLPGPGHYLLQLEASSAGVSAFWNYAVEVVASGTVQTPEPTPSPPAGSEPAKPIESELVINHRLSDEKRGLLRAFEIGRSPLTSLPEVASQILIATPLWSSAQLVVATHRPSGLTVTSRTSC